MTKYYKNINLDESNKMITWSGEIDIDLTKYNLEIQNLLKDILKIMGYEE